ncbi:MAG: 50S ribosome-binding GTPase [Candidatus Lokiarchaeota archaeon]|nr:50S ribosome-binding GTPase [Candidatus Lokiarchaeota archaeon]
MANKITIIGPPEMGKTTIKKVIFEGEDPSDLILFPLEATIGIKYSVHQFMDSKVSLIDAPGQSLPIILQDEQKQILAFGDAGAIIYVFDYPTWISDSQDIIDDIKKIYEINKKHEFGAKIILFLHKIDLIIKKKIGTLLSFIRKQIIKQLDLPEELPLYFTSLHPNLIYTTYNAISNTISNFSENTSTLKENIKNKLKNSSKTICFVTNQDNYILIQEISEDFDTNILYYLYEEVYNLSKSPETITLKSNVVSLGPKLFNKIITSVNNHNPNFKYIIIFSETLEKEDMIKILDELKKDLN